MTQIEARNLKVGTQYIEPRTKCLVEVIEIESITDKAITVYTKSIKVRGGWSQFSRSFERKRLNTKLSVQ